MAYTTNINLLRNGFIKNWEFKNFPQKKKYYNKHNTLIIKLYFWLRFFLLYYKIRLVQFHNILFEGKIISCNIMINRSLFKKCEAISFWLQKSFLKKNTNALKILYSQSNLLKKIECYYKTKKLKYSKKYKKLKIKQKTNFLKVGIQFKSNAIKSIDLSKLRIIWNYLNIKFAYYTKVKNFQKLYLKNSKLFQFYRILQYKKNSNILIDHWNNKKLVDQFCKTFLKTTNSTNKSLFNMKQKTIKFKKSFKKNLSLIKVKLILEQEIYKFLLLPICIKIRFEPLKYLTTLEMEDILLPNNFKNHVAIKLSKSKYYGQLTLPKLIMYDIDDYNDYFWKLNQRKLFTILKFKKLENVLMAAILYNNIQILADFISMQVSKSHYHRGCITSICIQLNKLRSQYATLVYRYRIGLYGRVNNATRSRAIFFSSNNFNKPKKNTYSAKLYFAESSSIAQIGVFRIRIWFEILKN